MFECTFICISGINPADLSGTNTGVFMNSCVSESEFFEVFDTHQKGFGLLGHNRAMQANRLSYTLNLNGEFKVTIILMDQCS